MSRAKTRVVFGRYLIVGCFNTLLDISLFTVLTNLGGLAPLVANVVSTCFTLCVSYLLNRLFVFRSDRKHAHAVVPFVAVTLFSGLLVQSAVIWLVMHVGESATPHAPTEVLTPFAKVCATAVGMISNFLGYRLLFGEASSDRGRVDEPAAASTGGSDRGRTRQPYRSVRNRQSSGKRTTSSMERR